MYCVVFDGTWRLAIQSGRKKNVLPEAFKTVRAACRAAAALNDALWARQMAQEAT